MPEGPTRIPLCSSTQITATLRRLGCYPGAARRGSHLAYHRRRSDGHILTAPVVLGKREVSRGTLRSILELLEISLDEFMEALR
jgi:predicted RNA binding protein YcfA (HicA-like mRNA interferase family)